VALSAGRGTIHGRIAHPPVRNPRPAQATGVGRGQGNITSVTGQLAASHGALPWLCCRAAGCQRGLLRFHRATVKASPGPPHSDTSSPNTYPSSQPTPNWIRADQLSDQDRPARGGAAARGRCCDDSVRTRRTVPGSPRGSGRRRPGLPAHSLGLVPVGQPMTLTLSAWGPFWPWVMSNSTFCPSSRLR